MYGTFDVVVADLCLHYFLEEETKQILREIQRILLPDGHLIFRVNSVNDKNHGAGEGVEVEHHVYEMGNRTLKSFFDEADIRLIFSEFQIEYLNEEIMTSIVFLNYLDYKHRMFFRECSIKNVGIVSYSEAFGAVLFWKTGKFRVQVIRNLYTKIS